jgi:cyclic lactone autoinducer peptide
MKILKDVIIKCGEKIVALSLMVSAVAINGNCWFFFHDPEVPNEFFAYENDST